LIEFIWTTGIHCKKRFDVSLPPAGMSLTKPWAGIIKFFPIRESLVSDIPAGDGKNDNLFYSAGSEVSLAFV
jgi:hypothetical protein